MADVYKRQEDVWGKGIQMETKENLKERLKHQVMERMDISRTMEDEEILELVQKTLEEDSHRMPMSISMRQNLIREI